MIAVAGGVSLKMAPNITVSRPAIVVVGSTITNNPDPLKITQQLQLAFKECL
jgi:3-keto-L-gulonate-6-phosphate decarboxylase